MHALVLATVPACTDDPYQARLINAVTISGADNQTGHRIVADDAGALYVSGISGGLAEVGGVTIPFTDQIDGWLIKLRPDGALDWTTSFTGAGQERPSALAVDSAGRAAAAGFFSGELSAAGQTFTSQGLEDGFVSIFASDGAPAWIRTIAADGVQSVFIRTVAFDAQGQVLAAGRSGGALTCDALSLPDSGGFVLQLSSSDGSCNWLHSLGGMSVRSVAASGTTLAVGGDFFGTLSLGGTTVEARAQSDGVVVLLAPDGTPATVIALPSSGLAQVHDIHIEDSGSMIVVGVFEYDLDLGGRQLETEAQYAFFALRLDASGTVRAAHAVAVETLDPDDLDISVAPLGQGRYALAASYSGSLTPGEFPEFSWDAFVAVLDQDLEFHGLTDVGRSNGYTKLYDITGVGENAFWAVGSFELRLELDGVELTSVGGDDAMALHFELGE